MHHTNRTDETNLLIMLANWLDRSSRGAGTNFHDSLWPFGAERILITRYNLIPIAVPPLLLYVFQCYLVRRPETRFLRLSVGLLLVPWLVWLTFGVLWFPERTMALNVPFTTTGVLFAIRATEYSFVANGRLKLEEKVPGEAHLDPRRPLYRKIFDGFYDAVELCLSQRGMGWDFGTGEGLRLPAMQWDRPVHHRNKWLLHTIFFDIFCNYLIVDAINTWWRTIPEISSPIPAAKAFRTLSFVKQLTIPGSVMVVVSSYMSMWYEVAAVLDVAILKRDPATWPVLFGRPWRAQSLHALWAMEWHQLSRRTFLTTVGYPLGALFGTPGVMLGAFIASGLYHNLMLIGDGLPGFNVPTMSFFVIQAFGLIGERGFRQYTGRKVGGLWGNVWVILFLLVTVQPMAGLWLDRGYMETSPIPKQWSVLESSLVRLSLL